jgi:hypothetical protein
MTSFRGRLKALACHSTKFVNADEPFTLQALGLPPKWCHFDPASNPLSNVVFCLHWGISNLSLYKHWCQLLQKAWCIWPNLIGWSHLNIVFFLFVFAIWKIGKFYRTFNDFFFPFTTDNEGLNKDHKRVVFVLAAVLPNILELFQSPNVRIERKPEVCTEKVAEVAPKPGAEC